MFEANLFQGQRVLITGGGTGLGLAMAAKLAELGAELHLCGRRHSVVQQACEMLSMNSTFASPRPCTPSSTASGPNTAR